MQNHNDLVAWEHEPYSRFIKFHVLFEVDLLSWVRSSFSNGAHHVLHIFLGLFVRWKVSGHTSVMLEDVALMICLKQHAVFLWSHHLGFTHRILSKSKWCNHTVELIRKYDVIIANNNQIIIIIIINLLDLLDLLDLIVQIHQHSHE